MKRYLNHAVRFYLQRFADDPAGDPQPAPGTETTEGSGEDAEKQPADEKKYSDSELDRIISKKKAAWKAEAEKQIEAARTEAEKLAKMNDEEKHRYEAEKKDSRISELEKKLAELEADRAKADLSREVTKQINEDYGMTATPDMLDLIVTGDAESTASNMKKLIAVIQEDRKAQEMKRATGKTPRSYGGVGGKETPFDKVIQKYK